MRKFETRFREVSGIIIEYLYYHGYIETAKVFEKETNRIYNERPGSAIAKQFSSPFTSPQQKEQVKREMIEYYRGGKQENFFSLWEKFIPPKLRCFDQQTLLLEFYIKLYFATFAARNKLEKKLHRELVAEFKKYLDEKGNMISSSYPEICPFISYIYVTDPVSHPTFSKIFKKEWEINLLQDLIEYLDEVFTQPIEEPTLHKLINRSGEQNVRTSLSLSKSMDEQTQLEFTNHLKILQDKYGELYGLCSDLVIALKGCLQNKKLNAKFVECAQEKLERMSVEKTIPSTPRIATKQNLNKTTFAPLDFAKLKQFLLSDRDIEKPYVLQALRWRINRSKKLGGSRKEVVLSYIKNDIFQLSNLKSNILLQLLNDKKSLIVEYTIRLVNTLISDNAGVTYILNFEDEANYPFMDILMKIIKSEKSDTILRQLSVGILQKLSLKSRVRRKLIEKDCIDLLLDVLKNGASECSDYTTEYGSALLMHLCLGNGAKEKFEKNDQILSVLSDLLEHNNDQVRTYVNGVLYSIMRASKKMREKAQDIGMEEFLKEVYKRSNDTLKKQINFILEQLNSEEEQQIEEEESDEEQSEEEDLGDEYIEDEETLLMKPDQPAGEDLLCQLFLASSEHAKKEIINIRSSMQSTLQKKFTNKPNVRFSFDNVQSIQKDDDDEEINIEEDFEDDDS